MSDHVESCCGFHITCQIKCYAQHCGGKALYQEMRQTSPVDSKAEMPVLYLGHGTNTKLACAGFFFKVIEIEDWWLESLCLRLFYFIPPGSLGTIEPS
jgi:hypothetical protein